MDCNSLIGVNVWVHWLICSSAHVVIPLCQGECKTIERIKIHTKYIGADSLCLSPSKRPLVDRNREIDFLQWLPEYHVFTVKLVTQTAKIQIRMNFDRLVGKPAQPFKQIPEWGSWFWNMPGDYTHWTSWGPLSLSI